MTEDRRNDHPDRARGNRELLVRHTLLHRLEPHAGAVVRDVSDVGRPDDPVARLVAAAGRVGDRVDDRARDLVGDDEGQQSFRQEPGLEDPSPVLVRDSAPAAMADRLDDGDPDVSRELLDRIDHGLDALPSHHCLDLDHGALLSMKTTSRQTPLCRPIRSRVPTTRKPQRLCSSSDATFSGKIPVWIVQIPSSSERRISSSSNARPTPRP